MRQSDRRVCIDLVALETTQSDRFRSRDDVDIAGVCDRKSECLLQAQSHRGLQAVGWKSSKASVKTIELPGPMLTFTEISIKDQADHERLGLLEEAQSDPALPRPRPRRTLPVKDTLPPQSFSKSRRSSAARFFPLVPLETVYEPPPRPRARSAKLAMVTRPPCSETSVIILMIFQLSKVTSRTSVEAPSLLQLSQ